MMTGNITTSGRRSASDNITIWRLLDAGGNIIFCSAEGTLPFELSRAIRFDDPIIEVIRAAVMPGYVTLVGSRLTGDNKSFIACLLDAEGFVNIYSPIRFRPF